MWVVDTPEAMPSGTIVDVAVGLVSGQTAVFFTNVRLDGAIAVEAEAFYTESTSQAAVTSDANAAESLTVHTAPGNVVKLIPYFTPPLAGVAPDTAAYTNFFLHEIASRYAGEFSGAGSAADAGLESAENLQGFFDVTDDWNFNLSGYGFRFTDSGFSETGRCRRLASRACRTSSRLQTRCEPFPARRAASRRRQHTVVSLRKR